MHSYVCDAGTAGAAGDVLGLNTLLAQLLLGSILPGGLYSHQTI